MLIVDVTNCSEFIAGDNTLLREILHPDKSELSIRYSLAHAVVPPGKTSWLHSLKTSEVYFILKGEGIMHTDDESERVHPGQTIYIPPNARQCITNTGEHDLVFLCIVDPAWRPEDETVEENKDKGE